jgi:hypothetical protein
MKNTKLYKSLEGFKTDDGDMPVHFKYFPPLAVIGNMLIFLALFITCAALFIPTLILTFLKWIYDITWLKYEIKREELRKQKEREQFLNKIESHLLKYGRKVERNGLLYLEGFTFSGTESLKEFINNFLEDYNINNNTLIDPPYFQMLERSVIYCRRNKRRSLEDIFRITKHYYHDCTIVDVLKCLIQLKSEGKVTIQKCNDIKKYTFVHRNLTEYMNLDKPVEYFEEQEVSMKELIQHLKL